MAKTSVGYQVDQYSIAQSFFVKEQNGIFLTAVDLFFKTFTGSTTLPVMIELRPMVNGFPSSEVVIPGSEVSVNASNVNFSTNASLRTRFEFDEPIFLLGPRDYAIVVRTNTSKYELFAATGDTFVIGSTEERISKQQTLGSLFFSQNAATFTAAQELDLSFKLIRAKFKHTSGTVALRPASLPITVLDRDPISSNSGDTRLVFSQPNHGFQPNDRVQITMNGGSVGGLDSTHISGLQVIDSADFSGYSITASSAATGTTRGGGTAVTVEKNIPYHKLYPSIQKLEPQGTAITAGFKGTESKAYNNSFYGNATATNRYSKQAAFQPIVLNEDNIVDAPFAVVTDTIADSAGITNKSAEIQLTMERDANDSAVSPLIDLQRASLTLIANQIDKQAAADAITTGFKRPLLNTFVAESAATGGSAAAKHITKAFTLTEDAVGVKIILSANRPVDTDFQVWLRTASQDEDITSKDFVLQTEETTNPPDTDRNVFRDYEYLAGGPGGDLTAFKKFQIKIEMRSPNIAQAPVFKDLRAIALSV